MGRKTTKGKEKRLQRKEEKARLAASQAVVDKANQQENPLLPFPAFCKYEKNDLNLVLECKKVTSLDEETIDWLFGLEKANMESLYESCEWGWSDKNKREEMTEDAAWYLIARTTEGKPVAFSHFRFDLDFGEEVLYCYEIQLESEVRRKGLGKFLLQVLELMAFTSQMNKVILTVLKHNPEARAFFKSMKYDIDETSPEDTLLEEFHYEILSKPNRKKLMATNNST